MLPEWIQNIADYAESRRSVFLIGMAIVLCILFLLIAITAGAGHTDRTGPARAPVPPEDLFLFDEPGQLPDVVPSRERRQKWTDEDFQEWFREPGDADLQSLTDVYTQDIDTILDTVP